MKLYKKLMMGLLMFHLYGVEQLQARPLNILFVVEYFPAPSQPHIVHLITGLIDKGHHVSILSFKQNNVEGHADIAKYSLMNLVTYNQNPTVLPECDIIFCQSATLGKKILAIPGLKSWLKKRKLVVSLRGHDITQNAVKINPKIYRKLFARSDLFLPVCGYFKNLAVRLGCAPYKIKVHHSAIDCSQFFFKQRSYEKNEAIQLVSVCRLIEKKGLIFAIQAIAQVIKKYPRIHYTIVGDGSERGRLEGAVRQLRLTNNVTFVGWKSPDEIVDILNKAHVFVLPSITATNGDEEGIANALKESMAMGLISIGTLHAGTPELITDGVSGFLVPQKNSNALAQKINYIIENSKMWPLIARAARQKIEDEFETKQSIDQLESIFYELLGQEIMNN